MSSPTQLMRITAGRFLPDSSQTSEPHGSKAGSGDIFDQVAAEGELKTAQAERVLQPSPELKSDTVAAIQDHRDDTRFSEPVLPLPLTGEIRSLWNVNDPEIVLAPLRVVTASGSANYYVKIVDWNTGVPILVFFIRSGEVASVRVPLGSYQFKYAAGEKWFGEEYLFGPDTSYRRADQQLDFRLSGDKIAGFTLELIKQEKGNLRDSEIKASDF